MYGVLAIFHFFWFFPSPKANTPTSTVTQNKSKDTVPNKEIPFLKTKI